MFCVLCFSCNILNNTRQPQQKQNETQTNTKKLREKTHTNTGHPAQPEPDKYLFAVGSWPGRAVFLALCCFFFFNRCYFFCLVFLSFCMYKRSNSNKTTTKASRKTNKRTALPAHDSTANKYISGSGWAGCPVFFCFSQSLFDFCLVLLNMLHENNTEHNTFVANYMTFMTPSQSQCQSQCRTQSQRQS